MLRPGAGCDVARARGGSAGRAGPPAAHGIDAEALAKEFAAKYGLPIERARHVVQVLVNELSTEAWATDAAESAKPKGGQENAADLSKACGLGLPRSSRPCARSRRPWSGLSRTCSGRRRRARALRKPAPKVLDLRTRAGT
ncbi:MAG: hypothetical protein IPM35_02500 [Myxococcales bacterium]|nr:hypothetical protein [Myxococcales bacterium]